MVAHIYNSKKEVYFILNECGDDGDVQNSTDMRLRMTLAFSTLASILASVP
jgi:hypothetical protein